MSAIRILLAIALAFGLSACSSKFKTYNGPEVTEVQVHKAERRMYLLHGSEVLESYEIALGRQPVGHKQFEGDARTPEGTYLIDRRNPNSDYHLSIGISYPNVNDYAFATSAGQEPGGDIFIHGENGKGRNKGDWTYGCIAVTNKEMEDIYAMVRDGTPIRIFPDSSGPPPAPQPVLTVPLPDGTVAPAAVAQLENAEVVGTIADASGVTP